VATIKRNMVYWVGNNPTESEFLEFARRGLTIRSVEPTDELDLNLARGIVFCARPPDVGATCRRLDLVERALDHGLIVYLVAANDSTQKHLQVAIGAVPFQGPLSGNIRRRTGEIPPFEIAEVIARHDSGPHAEGALQVMLPPATSLSDTDQFLLRRAFSDCAAISLESLSGGRSASAFVAQATLKDSEVGPRPLPFFVKLDASAKILVERNNYDLFASSHIPWYLRPNLDSRRCVIGSERGILVGSFVEHSESLWEAVLKGRGSRYIHALFEETLMGWRSQGFRSEPRIGPIADSFSGAFNWEKVRPDYVQRSREFGEVGEPKNLWEDLLDLQGQKCRVAPMHGDLHAENVRVRNNDSIIIDLANTTRGPLCADVASLEVWLAFEVPSTPSRLPDRTTWTDFVTGVYSPAEISRSPSLAAPDVSLDWLRSCIRQTRMVAGAICECESEYATVVAIYLLRRACYSADDNNHNEDVFRRSYAYFLASRIIQHLSTLSRQQLV